MMTPVPTARRLLLLAVVFAVVIYATAHRCSKPVNIFWMPYCPYGQEATKILLGLTHSNEKIKIFYLASEYSGDTKPLKSEPSSDVRSAVHPSQAGCENIVSTKPDFGRFSSLHGTRETEESIRQVVISHQWPDLFFPYLKVFLEKPDGEWQARAATVGIPVEELDRWVHSSEGAQWFSENIRVAQRKGITVSPRLELDEKILSFPSNQEDLHTLLCSAGVLKDNCIGVLCSPKTPCPEKFGYTVACRQGKCIYAPAPLREDAVQAYLITPKDCVPAEEFPIAEGIKGWASALKITRLALTDSKAQDLLKETKISSFPVLVIEKELEQRDWGERCIQELNLTTTAKNYLVTFDYTATPFPVYADILRTESGELQVIPNHYAGALLLHKMEKWEPAAKSYRLALAQNPEDYRTWNNLGAIFYDTHGLKKTGLSMFQHSLALNDSYEPALSNLLRFYSDSENAKDPQIVQKTLAVKERLGWLKIEEKRWTEAAVYFRDVITNKDLEASARKGLAYIAVRENRPADALAELKRCLEINPQPDGDFANLLAGVYYRLSDMPEAIEWYEKAMIAGHPSNQAYPNLCHLLQSSEQWGKLLEIASQACDQYPEKVDFGFYKAQALAHLARKEEAILCLQELRQGSEEAAFRASYELAMLYHANTDQNAALENAQHFINTVAIQPRPMLQEECLKIGTIAFEFGGHALAVDAFKQILRMKPSDIVAHQMLVKCYRQLGQQELSQEHAVLAKQFGGGEE